MPGTKHAWWLQHVAQALGTLAPSCAFDAQPNKATTVLLCIGSCNAARTAPAALDPRVNDVYRNEWCSGIPLSTSPGPFSVTWVISSCTERACAAS
jgi:hypothetical protein